MNAQSLAAIVQLQRSMRAGHLDAEGVMHLITDWARSVANASGVAIGRLNGPHLTYAAGSGSAASFVGRCVMATFSPSEPHSAQAEILRADNTGSDNRIESAICRQFGVKSLLILPVYKERALAGVLQVLFNEAHSFREQEVRTYWLLAGLVGEALSQPVQSAQKQVAAPALSVSNSGTAEIVAPTHRVLNRIGPLATVNRSVVGEICESSIQKSREFPAVEKLRQTALGILQVTRNAGLYQSTALVAVALLLAVPWILSAHRPSALAPVTAPSQLKADTNSDEGPASLAPANEASADTPSAAAVRYLAPAVLKPSSRPYSRVKHFGDDVTVRYFFPAPAVIRASADGEVHRFSNDVTVRYFRPRNPDAPSQAVESEVSRHTSAR